MILLDTQANIVEGLRSPPNAVLFGVHRAAIAGIDHLNLSQLIFIQPELQSVGVGVEVPLHAGPLVLRNQVVLRRRLDVGRMFPAIGQPVGIAVHVGVGPGIVVGHEVVVATVEPAEVHHRSDRRCARFGARGARRLDEGEVAAAAVLAAEIDHHAAVNGLAQFSGAGEAVH